MTSFTATAYMQGTGKYNVNANLKDTSLSRISGSDKSTVTLLKVSHTRAILHEQEPQPTFTSCLYMRSAARFSAGPSPYYAGIWLQTDEPLWLSPSTPQREFFLKEGWMKLGIHR